MIDLSLVKDWKANIYNLIFVFLNKQIKIIYFKLVKIIINKTYVIKRIIDIFIEYFFL